MESVTADRIGPAVRCDFGTIRGRWPSFMPVPSPVLHIRQGAEKLFSLEPDEWLASLIFRHASTLLSVF